MFAEAEIPPRLLGLGSSTSRPSVIPESLCCDKKIYARRLVELWRLSVCHISDVFSGVDVAVTHSSCVKRVRIESLVGGTALWKVPMLFGSTLSVNATDPLDSQLSFSSRMIGNLYLIFTRDSSSKFFFFSWRFNILFYKMFVSLWIDLPAVVYNIDSGAWRTPQIHYVTSTF